MRKRVAIVYNKPIPSRYDTTGEGKAVLGVLDAVNAVHQALIELNYEVACVPLVPPLKSAEGRLSSLDADLVFNLFEGFCGYPETEAIVPEALSELRIPFTGCSSTALRLCLDKAKVKVLLQTAGIHSPVFQLLSPGVPYMFRLGYPCIVKPRSENASHGLSEASVVTDLASLEKQARFISSSYNGGAIVEEFIEGREFNTTVLGNSQGTVLPVSEIVYSLPSEMPRILTFDAKWETDSLYFHGTKAVCPAEISAEEHEIIIKTALAAFRLLGCRGYARVDMRLNKEGQLNVIEVNPNPDISPDAGAARQAGAAGMTYTQFIEKIVQLALEKQHMKTKIRCMLKKDKPALMQILQDTPEFKLSEVVVAEEVIDSYLKDPDNSGYYALVAEDGSGITGYICYGPTPLTEGTWDVYWEAVAQEKRGQGTGSGLTKAAEREIRKAKGRLALIETSSTPAYEKTRLFYLGLGYDIIARIPDFYSPGDDKLVLQKRLK